MAREGPPQQHSNESGAELEPADSGIPEEMSGMAMMTGEHLGMPDYMEEMAMWKDGKESKIKAGLTGLGFIAGGALLGGVKLHWKTFQKLEGLLSENVLKIGPRGSGKKSFDLGFQLGRHGTLQGRKAAH